MDFLGIWTRSSRRLDKTLITAYIGIGSNLGDRRGNCLRAVEMIKGLPDSQDLRCSDWYLTRPVGGEAQDWYVNGVVSLFTEIPARDLLGCLLRIEQDLGRVRKEHWGPRVIDLDLLLYGDEIIREETLTIPHPLLHLRRFVLVPMVQLNPDKVHPTVFTSMADLLGRLPEDDQEVLLLGEDEYAAEGRVEEP